MSNCSQVFHERAVLMNFIGKHLCRSLFYNKVSRIQAKERLLYRCFLVSFTKYFRTIFAKQFWVAASPKYLFLFVTPTSARKIVSFNLGYFKYFRDKHWNACEPHIVEVLVSWDYVDLLLIEQVICPKCCWKLEAVANFLL